jgi:hypothetical protein
MEDWYDIPLEIPMRINSDITDPMKHSTVHYLDTKQPLTHTDGTWLFPLPSHESSFWTHLKYVCHGIEDPLAIGIVAQTQEGEWVELLPLEPRSAALWLETEWPIPSIPIHRTGGQLYLQLTPIPHNQHMTYLKVKLLGYSDLFQDTSFVLLQTEEQPRLLLIKEGNGNDEALYTIFSPTEELMKSLSDDYHVVQPIHRIQDY